MAETPATTSELLGENQDITTEQLANKHKDFDLSRASTDEVVQYTNDMIYIHEKENYIDGILWDEYVDEFSAFTTQI